MWDTTSSVGRFGREEKVVKEKIARLNRAGKVERDNCVLFSRDFVFS